MHRSRLLWALQLSNEEEPGSESSRVCSFKAADKLCRRSVRVVDCLPQYSHARHDSHRYISLYIVLWNSNTFCLVSMTVKARSQICIISLAWR